MRARAHQKLGQPHHSTAHQKDPPARSIPSRGTPGLNQLDIPGRPPCAVEEPPRPSGTRRVELFAAFRPARPGAGAGEALGTLVSLSGKPQWPDTLHLTKPPQDMPHGPGPACLAGGLGACS